MIFCFFSTIDIVTVDCEAEEIESFPILSDYNIQNLRLGDNKLKDLKSETFDNFTLLQTLTLNGNDISNLQVYLDIIKIVKHKFFLSDFKQNFIEIVGYF